ncbi:hypothetical protein J0S82_006434 [Galemys pyrenaicus]|uniref:Uncharacterized protein n=1 Tax=Galemys pyrenaicus TaxID=202257 RepID=A0A8J6A1Z5_GALPY|nr:hypothetical protein J0S82_006434 [Galemys pyrenaicus]
MQRAPLGLAARTPVPGPGGSDARPPARQAHGRPSGADTAPSAARGARRTSSPHAARVAVPTVPARRARQGGTSGRRNYNSQQPPRGPTRGAAAIVRGGSEAVAGPSCPLGSGAGAVRAPARAAPARVPTAPPRPAAPRLQPRGSGPGPRGAPAPGALCPRAALGAQPRRRPAGGRSPRRRRGAAARGGARRARRAQDVCSQRGPPARTKGAGPGSGQAGACVRTAGPLTSGPCRALCPQDSVQPEEESPEEGCRPPAPPAVQTQPLDRASGLPLASLMGFADDFSPGVRPVSVSLANAGHCFREKSCQRLSGWLGHSASPSCLSARTLGGSSLVRRGQWTRVSVLDPQGSGLAQPGKSPCCSISSPHPVPSPCSRNCFLLKSLRPEPGWDSLAFDVAPAVSLPVCSCGSTGVRLALWCRVLLGLLHAGHGVAKPEVIALLERGEEPWPAQQARPQPAPKGCTSLVLFTQRPPGLPRVVEAAPEPRPAQGTFQGHGHLTEEAKATRWEHLEGQ